MRPGNDNDVQNTTCIFGCLIILFIVIVGISLSAFTGWLTMVVLAGIGIHLSFWVCWGIWILLSSLFGMAKK